MPSVPCFGVCGGAKGWKSPSTGPHCTLCQGSGVYTSYDEAKLAADAWDKMKADRKASDAREKERRQAGHPRIRF
jgi:hypothetical protein